MKISVCIPAYNRPEELGVLLETILSQGFTNYQVLVGEDHSPKRGEIRNVIKHFQVLHREKIILIENSKNLGYDANLRNIIESADGDYCWFMGNDDLMCVGAMQAVASALAKYQDVGVVLRSYASFDGTPENINQTFRYFADERFFPAGPETVTTFFRRSVVISGMVVHRQTALKFSTDRFDGTLLYQLYLVANILLEKNGVFLPEILVLYRNGGIPDFGNSDKERGRFVPKEQTPASSLHFMRGMLQIAARVETERQVNIFKPIRKDIGNYSYPILAIQAGKPLLVFLKYAVLLASLGFWRYWRFHLYALSLLFLGPTRVERVIKKIKKRCGYTPTLGRVYGGDAQ